MERITRFRAGVILAIVTSLILFLAGRLYFLQIVETGGQIDNTTTFTTATRVKAARGALTDINGNVLVGNRASYDLVLNHYVLTNSTDPNGSLYELVRLCRELGITYKDHLPISHDVPFRYTLEESSGTWQSYFHAYLVDRELDSDISAPLLIRQLRERYGIPREWSDEDARAVLGLRYELSLRTLDGTGLSNFVFLSDVDNTALAAISELNIPGMRVEASTVREYYTDAAPHVLGYVGSMSPEQWEYYQTVDHVPGISDYLMDAEVGQSGFELAFEEYLHGIDGWRYDEVTADGTIINTWYDPAPIAGSNVEVTLDLSLQVTAEEALNKVMEDLFNSDYVGKNAEGSAVVAMDVKTGQILVSASYPDYDLATFFEDYDTLATTKNNPLLNRALMGLYAPGSTYKMVMVTAAIQNGFINSQTEIQTKGYWNLGDNLTLSCVAWSNRGTTHGHITASQALKFSCNYFFYQLGHWMDISYNDAVAKALGLGEPTGVELFEYTGSRANPETKDALYSEGYNVFGEADRLQASIGQSDNRFTPLQLCVYTTSLANQGIRYRATFLNRVLSADYRTLVYDQQPEVMSTLEMSDETYNAIVKGMTMVTGEEGGTAYGYFYDYPIPVAAKTGTAQTGFDTVENGSFVCFAPANDPQIAIAVYGEKVGSGGSLAEVARAILEAYFERSEAGTVTPGENVMG